MRLFEGCESVTIPVTSERLAYDINEFLPN